MTEISWHSFTKFAPAIGASRFAWNVDKRFLGAIPSMGDIKRITLPIRGEGVGELGVFTLLEQILWHHLVA